MRLMSRRSESWRLFSPYTIQTPGRSGQRLDLDGGLPEPGHLVRAEEPAAHEKPVPAVIGELLGGQEARLPGRGAHGTRTTFP